MNTLHCEHKSLKFNANNMTWNLEGLRQNNNWKRWSKVGGEDYWTSLNKRTEALFPLSLFSEYMRKLMRLNSVGPIMTIPLHLSTSSMEISTNELLRNVRLVLITIRLLASAFLCSPSGSWFYVIPCSFGYGISSTIYRMRGHIIKQFYWNRRWELRQSTQVLQCNWKKQLVTIYTCQLYYVTDTNNIRKIHWCNCFFRSHAVECWILNLNTHNVPNSIFLNLCLFLFI